MIYFELIFGIIWTAAAILFAIIYFVNCGVQNFTLGDLGNIISILIAGIIVGGPFLYFGLKQFIADRKTKRKGEICFGYIDGLEICGVKNHIAKIKVYIPKKQRVLEVEDDVYRKKTEYSEGDFVRVKIYNGDINVISKVEPEELIPEDIRNLLRPKLSVVKEDNGEDSKEKLDISDINTENWTLTEEAFSSEESFVQNVNGEYERKINQTEKKGESHNQDDKKTAGINKKMLKDFLKIVAVFALVCIIIFVIFFSI